MPVYAEKELVDGQKRWYIRTYAKDEFGNTKQITRHNKSWIGREGKKEAEWEEKRLKNSIISSDKNVEKNITFKRLFELKCEYDKIYNNNSESTRITYQENLRNHVFPLIGDKIVNKLTKNDMLLIIKYLKEYISPKGKNKGKHLSNKFMNEIIHTIRSIIKFGCEFHDINCEVLKYLIDIQPDRDEVVKVDAMQLIQKKTILSSKDWEKVSAAMEQIISQARPDKKERTIKLMLFLTTEYILMTRVGETQAMTYANLLFDYGIYNLYEAYNKKLKRVTPTKNRDSRILYIPNSLAESFMQLYELDSKKPGFNLNQFIFGKNKVFPRTTIDRYRTQVLEIANINYMTNHELRHAGISNAMYSNADPSALADMAGHDKEIMYKIYVQTLKDANYDLINTLDKLRIPQFAY